MFKLVLEKAEEPEIKCQHLLDHGKSKSIPENIYSCFIHYAKAFDSVDNNKLWKILQEMEIPNHLICLLRNLYAGQEDPLEKGMATHFSILAWRMPWTEKPGGLQSTGSQNVKHD